MQNLKKILCPVDFSSNSEKSLSQAVQIAKLHGSEITILHVISALPNIFIVTYGVDSDVFDLERIRVSTRNMLDAMVAKLVPEAVKCVTLVKEGDVAETIKSVAESIHADLIVMATSGSDSFDQRILGSTTSKVTRTAPCPVISLNDFTPRISFKKILVPVERRFGIREVRKYIENYFNLNEPEITLLSVISADADDAYKKDEMRFLAQEVAFFNKEGVKNIKTEVATSADPAAEIALTVEANNFDLVILNTHGRSGLGRLVMGSVTEHVLQSCKVPICTIRPGRGEVSGFLYHQWAPF